jgi:hypothetical protein
MQHKGFYRVRAHARSGQEGDGIQGDEPCGCTLDAFNEILRTVILLEPVRVETELRTLS